MKSQRKRKLVISILTLVISCSFLRACFFYNILNLGAIDGFDNNMIQITNDGELYDYRQSSVDMRIMTGIIRYKKDGKSIFTYGVDPYGTYGYVIYNKETKELFLVHFSKQKVGDPAIGSYKEVDSLDSPEVAPYAEAIKNQEGWIYISDVVKNMRLYGLATAAHQYSVSLR